MTGLNENGQIEGATVYHAGTKKENGKFYTNGGRVLGVTATDTTLEGALKKAYNAVSKIHFEGAHYRTDIGKLEKDRSCPFYETAFCLFLSIKGRVRILWYTKQNWQIYKP